MKIFKKISFKFNTMNIRERGLIAMTVISLLGWMGYNEIEETWNKHSEFRIDVSKLTRSNTALKSEVSGLEVRSKLDPNEEYLNRLKTINDQINFLDKQLTLKNVVPASYMPILLNSILKLATSVDVISFSSLPPEFLLGENNDNVTDLYSHGVTMGIKGNYFSILSFLKSIEALPDKLYWKSMNYKVTNYPNADVLLEFYTISINKDFISVAE